MQVLPAAEIKNRFGRISNIVKSGEPVTITQYGEPTMMLLPLKIAQEALRLYYASQQGKAENGLLKWLEARKQEVSPEEETLSIEEINKLVHELR
ncbi:MAG: type II toxin-antitoxin system prevent-host-death family antitoxin [Gammaproteobacteria bacterium]|nr:type II toxin-antitoxin system prevent-host-death family antitoxin [Gammaproteobacteria bacterium]MBU1724309.1 type II toxin-antitoxin system prevent-host-death family antitoxin [Gammaproteobacteria bacterium]MBU2006263.1 type II toxin-antitoxin system prevent-host-death family antitoxin [Gammaproteobacteria bacterium]